MFSTEPYQYIDNCAFTGMRTKTEVIAASLNLYYDGLSTWKIQRQIAKIFKVDVSVTVIWKWIMKYSEFVDDYVSTLQPQLSGRYHHDETEIKVGGEDKYFWETLDKDTRFLVAHLLSESRSSDKAKEVFAQALKKQRPTALFTDGSFSYDEVFNKVHYTRNKVNRIEGVRRAGFRERETNNIIERKHGTLKDRSRPTRGLKHDKTAEKWLNGYAVNYNFVKPHFAPKGKTPAQAAGLNIKAEWGDLIKQATLSSVKKKHGKNPVTEVLSK
jgi:transposase-like protein